jgi:hypothetical protein
MSNASYTAVACMPKWQVILRLTAREAMELASG